MIAPQLPIAPASVGLGGWRTGQDFRSTNDVWSITSEPPETAVRSNVLGSLEIWGQPPPVLPGPAKAPTQRSSRDLSLVKVLKLSNFSDRSAVLEVGAWV